MKVFISWSGELSKSVAKELSEWLPSIIHTIEVFYSPEDIQKGENWDLRLTKELEESKYGIVCLTKENVLAPWVNFESGALSKTLDSHISALMIDIEPSDIQGPLSRFQATRLEKDDFYQLVCDINIISERQIPEKVLKNTYDAVWDKMSVKIQNTIRTYDIKGEHHERKSKVNDILEELLQLIRKHDTVLNKPEILFPEKYFKYLYARCNNYEKSYAVIGLCDFLGDLSQKIARSSYKYAEDNYAELCMNISMLLIDFAKKNEYRIGYDLPDNFLENNIRNMQYWELERYVEKNKK